MNVEIRTEQRPNQDNDACQYAAATALDEVLFLFVDDGYTRDDIQEMIDARLADLFAEDEA